MNEALLYSMGLSQTPSPHTGSVHTVFPGCDLGLRVSCIEARVQGYLALKNPPPHLMNEAPMYSMGLSHTPSPHTGSVNTFCEHGVQTRETFAAFKICPP